MEPRRCLTCIKGGERRPERREAPESAESSEAAREERAAGPAPAHPALLLLLPPPATKEIITERVVSYNRTAAEPQLRVSLNYNIHKAEQVGHKHRAGQTVTVK